MIFSWDGLDIDRRDCGGFRGQSRGKEVHPVPPVSPGPGPVLAPWMGLSSCPPSLDIDQFSVTSLDTSQHHQESHTRVYQQLNQNLGEGGNKNHRIYMKDVTKYNFQYYIYFNFNSFNLMSNIQQNFFLLNFNLGPISWIKSFILQMLAKTWFKAQSSSPASVGSIITTSIIIISPGIISLKALGSSAPSPQHNALLDTQGELCDRQLCAGRAPGK